MAVVIRIFVSVSVMVAGWVVALGGPANAGCIGSSICNPANAPLLNGLKGGKSVIDLTGKTPVVSLPGTAAATGSTSTAATTVSTGATTINGVSIASEALGGTAGLVLLGAGVGAYKLLVDDPAVFPDAGSPPSGPLSFTLPGKALNKKWGAAEPRELAFDMNFVFDFEFGFTTGGMMTVTGTVPGTGQEHCTAGNGNYCKTAIVSVKAEPQCTDSGYGGTIAKASSVTNLDEGPRPFTFVFDFGICSSPKTLDGVRLTVNDVSGAPWEPIQKIIPDEAPQTGGGRYLQDTITCKSPGGNTYQITADGPVGFGVSELTSAGLQCTDGDRLIDHESTVVTEGQPEIDLGKNTAPPELDLMPDSCFSNANLCELDLQKRNMVGEWESDFPEEWSQVRKNPELWRCRVGGPNVAFQAVPLNWCQSMVPDPAGNITPVPQRDAQPNPNANPAPAPGGAPGPGGSTNPDGTINPAPAPAPGGTPNPLDANCDMGWSDFLTGYVLVKGVKCALVWAFVPEPAAMAQLQSDISTSWAGTPPVVLWNGVTAFMAPIGALSGAGDCLGPTIDIPRAGLDNAHPFQACTGTAATISSWWIPVASVVVYVLTAFQALRVITRTGLNTGTPVGE